MLLPPYPYINVAQELWQGDDSLSTTLICGRGRELFVHGGVLGSKTQIQIFEHSSIVNGGTRPFFYMMEQFVSMGVRDHFFTLWRHPQ